MSPLFSGAAADRSSKRDTSLSLPERRHTRAIGFQADIPLAGWRCDVFGILGKCVLIRDQSGRPRLPRSQYQYVKKEDTSVSFSTRRSLYWAARGRSTQRKVFSMNVGTNFAVSAGVMNKNSLILRPRQKLSLGDLILAVSSCTKSSRETVATVADLLGSGQVRVEDHGRFLRAKVC
jgi:hypothetical protein